MWRCLTCSRGFTGESLELHEVCIAKKPRHKSDCVDFFKILGALCGFSPPPPLWGGPTVSFRGADSFSSHIEAVRTQSHTFSFPQL